MLNPSSSMAPWVLASLTFAVTVWAIARASGAWRFDRLALRGFDSPGETTGPFRQSEPTLRPLYGLERDLGSLMFFGLHLMASLGGIVALATLMWFGVAVIGREPFAADTVAMFAALYAAVLAVPMWLGDRRLHGLLGAVMTVFWIGLWAPAVPLLLIIVVVQHDLIRRRKIADEREQERRDEHERARAHAARAWGFR